MFTTHNMSHVRCVSRVTGQVSHVTFFFWQSGEAYRWRVCYQRGLHRLVFENLGTERTGGIIRVVAVVNMVLNFLITDKSILAERSYVPSQVSNCSSTSARSSSILVQKGQGNLGWSKDESKVSENNILFSLLWCNWLVQCCKLAKFLH